MGLLTLTHLRFSFPSGYMGRMGKTYVPDVSIRQGHVPRFSLQNISRSEIVTSGLGQVRVGVPYPCSFFPGKHLLKQWTHNGGNLTPQL